MYSRPGGVRPTAGARPVLLSFHHSALPRSRIGSSLGDKRLTACETPASTFGLIPRPTLFKCQTSDFFAITPLGICGQPPRVHLAARPICATTCRGYLLPRMSLGSLILHPRSCCTRPRVLRASK